MSPSLSQFSADASSSLPGPPWLRARRRAAFERFEAADLPTEAEEVWRYSRIDQLDLDAYSPVLADGGAEPGLPSALGPIVEAVGDRAGLVVVRNGRVTHAELEPALERRGVVAGSLDATAGSEDLVGSSLLASDPFVELNTAFMADVAVVRVPEGVAVERPIVVVNWVDAVAGAVFPQLVVHTGPAAQVSVFEYVASPHDLIALTDPVVELHAGEASNLSYVGVQELGRGVWQLGHQASRVARDATLSSLLVALGGDYARVSTDSRLEGQGSTSRLRAAYFGDGRQMHDFRTLQDHDAPKTMSDLLFKGAVEEQSHAVYSGLIRIRKGAAGTNAFQTNRNLVLSNGAHADSVPNLEIEENDVRCSHASAVGPIDEDHRYYLEARGLPPHVAERLVVLGFFEEVVEDVPIPGLRQPLRRSVAAKLEGPQA
ncbi:MAG: Fe-S cluster assembly protein SufD [Actinomycetota bacterium]|nr:Fe-S cluster assembly protein SufD [Actinomycetota bacterium]